MYFNCFANDFGINDFQMYTKFMLVCARSIAGLLASAGAGGQSFCYFFLYTHASAGPHKKSM